MQKWLVPSNPNIYDAETSFEQNGFIDWRQNKNKYEVGDIVYLYCSQTIRKVRFKAIVEKVDIPSYRVKAGDVISLRDKSKSSPKFKDILEQTNGRTTPLWLEVNKEQLSAKVVRMPSIEDVDYEVAPHLIVELYSK